MTHLESRSQTTRWERILTKKPLSFIADQQWGQTCSFNAYKLFVVTFSANIIGRTSSPASSVMISLGSTRALDHMLLSVILGIRIRKGT